MAWRCGLPSDPVILRDLKTNLKAPPPQPQGTWLLLRSQMWSLRLCALGHRCVHAPGGPSKFVATRSLSKEGESFPRGPLYSRDAAPAEQRGGGAGQRCGAGASSPGTRNSPGGTGAAGASSGAGRGPGTPSRARQGRARVRAGEGGVSSGQRPPQAAWALPARLRGRASLAPG